MSLKLKRFLILTAIISTVVCTAFINENGKNASTPTVKTEENTSEGPKKEKFNPGDMIMEHVVDAHEWHVTQFGNVHVVVPLPILLYDQGKFVFFMSSKFEHGHKSYLGYKIEEAKGANNGKIVKVLPDGETTDKTAKLPFDFSITKTVFAMLLSLILMCFVFISVANTYKKHPNQPPRGLQAWIEPVILFVRDDIAKPSIGEERHARFMPFLLMLFFFILFNNLMGLIPLFPGGANVTGNIAVTMVLAVITFIITTFSTNKAYWSHLINMPGVPIWLKLPVPLMPFVEIFGVFIKPVVLMIRLFANITGGHIIILGFVCLIFIFGEKNIWLDTVVGPFSYAFMVFMNLLELLVAFLQAYVFTLLAAIYFGMAKVESHH
ncbi:MAG: F0F1 ATP synthase subunit A [Bacteroidetes bacterium]|nr:F0F1 ATP synthase subunit A [Bacteroidota bacterium]